jgi:hypothetical protein
VDSQIREPEQFVKAFEQPEGVRGGQNQPEGCEEKTSLTDEDM